MRIEFHNRATAGHNETKLRYNEGPDLLYRRRGPRQTEWRKGERGHVFSCEQRNNYPGTDGKLREGVEKRWEWCIRGVSRRCPTDNGAIISARHNVCRVTPRGNVRDSVTDHGVKKNVAILDERAKLDFTRKHRFKKIKNLKLKF